MQTSREFICHLCGNREHFDFVLDEPGLTVARCPVCGLVFEASPPGFEKLDYDNIYPPTPPQAAPAKAIRKKHLVWEKALRTAPGRRLLEIGCSYGFFLEHLRRNGWEAEGIDVSSNAIAYARQRGLNCSCSRIEEFRPAGKYDAVVLIHVLEHLSEPVEVLKVIASWLNPGGIAYLRVPNFASGLVNLSRADTIGHLKPREHLCYFTPATLEQTLARASYEARVWTEGRNSLADLVNNRLRRRLVISPSWRNYNYENPSGNKSLYTKLRNGYERLFLPILAGMRWGKEDREVVAIGKKTSNQDRSEPEIPS